MLEIPANTGISELYKMNTPTISMLNKGQNDTFNGEAVFVVLIDILTAFFHVEWTDKQNEDCAKVCFLEFYCMNFAELKLFSQRAKTCYYGQIYGKFNTATLIDWLVKFWSECLKAREDYYSKQPKNNFYLDENGLPREQPYEVLDEYGQPTDPVDPQRIKDLVKDLEREITKEREEEIKNRDEKIKESQKRYQELLKQANEKKQKGKDIQQPTKVPGNINDAWYNKM